MQSVVPVSNTNYTLRDVNLAEGTIKGSLKNTMTALSDKANSKTNAFAIFEPLTIPVESPVFKECNVIGVLSLGSLFFC